jgi:hypothetical protein
LAYNLGINKKESIESIENCFEVEEYMRNIKISLEQRFPSMNISNLIHRK